MTDASLWVLITNNLIYFKGIIKSINTDLTKFLEMQIYLCWNKVCKPHGL